MVMIKLTRVNYFGKLHYTGHAVALASRCAQ